MANFQFKPDFELPRGAKTRAIANIRAIELLQQIEAEDRVADEGEQEILAKYVGWGGIPQIFNPTPDPAWRDIAENLKHILTSDEYNAAFESVLNAHYTSSEVIQEIYRGLQHLGFSRGKILEPSVGTGNFLGHMPDSMSDSSEVTGIELDFITGRIAKQLYPEHDIYIQGFQETTLPHDYFDLAISNVPFGDYRIVDSEYNALDLKIHNYFFARSIDRVRPGGMMAFITSTGTMQSKSGKAFRSWMAERSNLIAAMRLPGSAFKETAGTEVTTDLILLQKLGPDVISSQENWIDLAETTIRDQEGNFLQTNEYFVRHPEMMLGELADDKLHPGRLALVTDGRNLRQAIQNSFASLPQNIYRQNFFLEPKVEDELRVKLPPDVEVKQFGYVAHGELLWQRQGEWLYPANLKGKTSERVLGMLDIRDAVQQVFEIQLQDGSDADLNQGQAKLNQVYDQFVKRHGHLTETANIRAFQDDPDAQLLAALERINEETGDIEKAEVFHQRTVRPRSIKSQAETPQEALIASLNEYGTVVTGYMASLLNQSEADLLSSLVEQHLIFEEPQTQRWLTQDEYLSGDVRQKLIAATTAAQTNPRFQINVDALTSVQPKDLEPGEIDVRFGAPWLPVEILREFAYDLLEVSPDEHKIEFDHNSDYAIWSVESSYSLSSNDRNNTVYGTEYITALKLIELSLNLKDATVYQSLADGTRVVDTQATLAARLKQQQIQDQFKSWLWQDFDRSETLCQIYNDLYNANVVRQFQNPNLEMPGSSPEITLRSHQKDAVWRILQSDSTLLAHVVGAGKTYTMIAGAMEMRRLDIAQKPMIVVPNHMLGQFTRELYELYPNAKVLAPTEKDTQKSKRKQLMAKIATGDWDAVIVTHSAFTRLPVSKSEQKKYLQDQVEELTNLLGDSDIKRGNGVVKQLAKERKRLEERIQKVNLINKDDGVTFEQLGIDALFVDEAHFWKNLGRPSKLTNIAGLSNTNSQRAMDAFLKTRLIRRMGGRLVFATGTPISNSIAEMYTMQRFLQPDALKAKKISSFDAWVGNFAEKVTAPEIAPTGQFKTKTRLTRFMNVPELMTLFRDVADIKTAKQLDLPRPEMERFNIAALASPTQLSYMKHLIVRAEAVAEKLVEPNEDNMLWVTTDGRRAALDMRLVNPELPDYPQSKVNQAVANIHAIWQATEQDRLAQMVFCDLGTPKKSKAEESTPFSVYQHIRDGLIERGIPAEEVAFIHDAAKSKDKEILYAQIREGQKRILIGSTEKCGVGMNIQTRLVAEHHLDPPWRPSDIEQREGRILRQGNKNSRVMILTYVTQGREGQLGFDSYSWQTLARKAEMVAQVMNGESTIRSVDDISSSALTFDEVKAIATGNPLIIEKATVDNRVTELSRYHQAFLNERHMTQRKLKQLPADIERIQSFIPRLQQDILHKRETKGDQFKITIGSKVYTKRKEAAQVLMNFVAQAQTSGKLGEQNIGEFAGFKLVAKCTSWWVSFSFHSSNGNVYYPEMRDTPQALMRSFESKLQDIPELLVQKQQQLKACEASLKTLSRELDKPFEYSSELEGLVERQFEINQALGLYKSDDQMTEAEPSKEEESLTQKKDQEELVDLDSLSSSDTNWNDSQVNKIWERATCDPSPDLIKAMTEQNWGLVTEVHEVKVPLESKSESQSLTTEQPIEQTPERLPLKPMPTFEGVEPIPENAAQLDLFPDAVSDSIEQESKHKPTTTDVLENNQSETLTPSVQESATPPKSKNIEETQTNWPIVAQAIERSSEYMKWVEQVSQHQFLDPKFAKSMAQDFAEHRDTLNSMRNWYKTAQELDRPKRYCDRIKVLGEAFKAGQPISANAMKAMIRDFQTSTCIHLAKGLDPHQPGKFIREMARRGLSHGIEPQKLNAILLNDDVVRNIGKINPRTAQKFVSDAITDSLKQFPELKQKQNQSSVQKPGRISM